MLRNLRTISVGLWLFFIAEIGVLLLCGLSMFFLIRQKDLVGVGLSAIYTLMVMYLIANTTKDIRNAKPSAGQ